MMLHYDIKSVLLVYLKFDCILKGVILRFDCILKGVILRFDCILKGVILRFDYIEGCYIEV